MDCQQSGTSWRHIERGADDVLEDEQVPTAVKEEDFILIAQESTSSSDSFSLNHLEILSGVLMSYCRIYESHF